MNILSFSLPMIPTLLTAWILNMSNRIFIEQYFSLKEVGIFSISYKIANLATVVLAALFTAYNPLFYRLANNNNEGKLREINRGLIFVMFVVCFVIAFLSKEIIHIFLNNSFHDAYIYVPILVSSVLLVQLGGLFNVMIYQNKNSIQIMWISITGAVFSVFVNFLLVPSYSLIGAAVASFVSALFIYILKYIVAKRNFYIETPIVIIVVAILACALILFIDMKFLTINIYYSLVIKMSLILFGLFFLYSKNKERISLFTNTI